MAARLHTIVIESTVSWDTKVRRWWWRGYAWIHDDEATLHFCLFIHGRYIYTAAHGASDWKAKPKSCVHAPAVNVSPPFLPASLAVVPFERCVACRDDAPSDVLSQEEGVRGRICE